MQFNKRSMKRFIVVFSALLITVVTIGFVDIMVKDQQQASTTDLSQSAYDSAQTGVEDAKRAIIRYHNICNSGGDCSTAASEINSQICNEAVKKLDDVTASGNEIAIQTGGNSNKLDQAYTCTKISLDTIDYLGKLSVNTSNLIPLSSGANAFDSIQIQWFSLKDLASNNNNYHVDLQSLGVAPLIPQSIWGLNSPSILQAQLIQFSGTGFKLSDFDTSDTSGNGLSTLFLYPSAVGTNSTFFANDSRKSATGMQLIKCQSSLSNGGYACAATIKLRNTAGGVGGSIAMLRLSALYNSSNYRITLLDSTKPVSSNQVPFNGVQPEVDSTGRANNLFRRIQTRVESRDINFPYPDNIVYGNICKNFIVTDDPLDYNNYNNSCTP